MTASKITYTTPDLRLFQLSVTPEMAKRWLATQNTRNRSLRPGVVARYARDMAAGEWRLTGETIKFATDGTLLDGQHRLAAVMKSGVVVDLYVANGIDKDAQGVMDSGIGRTAADALGIAQVPNAVCVAAAAKIAVAIEAGGGDSDKYPATHSEIHQWVEDNPGIHYAAEVARTVARRCDMPPATVAYAMWRMSAIDRFEAARFWTAAADKVGLTPGDPVIALTNRFAEARRNRESLNRSIQLSLIFRAWNARREGKSVRFLRVNSSAGGVVPIPDLR